MRHLGQRALLSLLTIVIVGSIGCSASSTVPTQPDDVQPATQPEPHPGTQPPTQPASFQPLTEAQYMRFNNGMGQRARLVIRNEAVWDDVWKKIASTSFPPPAVPAIDFDRNVVIVAAMGHRSSGGYVITVDDVRIAGEDADVTVTEQSPASCLVTAAFTEPLAVVLAPRFSGKATFIEHSVEYTCR
ncbi:MAG TPA: protease complex subunit PrcB family protein [Kofleriaceae bacterium]|nr:protease complex subunit PrcB family protein [Kofleriaceae bacterium]